ncbi:MAG: flagellar basal body rod protein FlgB [Alphaproteobacteria bacterium]|nr:flagellar basal body rod protein FlgB [Alphaproteobacteria bacterium]
MTIQDIGLFQGIGAKMEFLNQRQGVIAQNIANSDTPGYRPKDMKEVNFSKFLGAAIPNKGVSDISLVKTSHSHMGQGQEELNTQSRKQRETYEVAPAGNAVIMEEQLMKSGRTVMDYTLMTNIYQKHVGMIKTALGTR